ncbi:unnamed protein product [Mycena citricolor]|uniref:Dienelactone hydrolase domain-containing protein n=1 Tax=Mycena citricolor TaxID=2018698 RepID=A0AAD2H3J3_9AGAR|nr:unnamed protein product [Mycena citricolor]
MRHFSLLSVLTLFSASAVQGIVVPAVDPANHPHSSATGVKVQGHNETINGVLTYVSKPAHGKFDPKVAVLLLTDVFGIASIDSPLLADQWANAGFQVFVPDYLNGDALPLVGGNLTSWIVNHGEAQTTPPLLAVVDALKKQGIKRIATTGYCFGVGTTAHPSLLEVPNDFDLAKAQSHVPIEINNAELDTGFTPAVGVTVDGLMDDGQYKPGYARKQFNGVGHGFAVRVANLSDPVQVAAKQGAFDTSLAWIQQHLHH